MKCPVDDTTLAISSREGIEIDFCPQCRGVWLDRGELDKIIERAATSLAPAGAAPSRPQYDDRRYGYDDRYESRRYDDDDDYRWRGRRRKRRGSFLDDLFDFD